MTAPGEIGSSDGRLRCILQGHKHRTGMHIFMDPRHTDPAFLPAGSRRLHHPLTEIAIDIDLSRPDPRGHPVGPGTVPGKHPTASPYPVALASRSASSVPIGVTQPTGPKISSRNTVTSARMVAGTKFPGDSDGSSKRVPPQIRRPPWESPDSMWERTDSACSRVIRVEKFTLFS